MSVIDYRHKQAPTSGIAIRTICPKCGGKNYAHVEPQQEAIEMECLYCAKSYTVQLKTEAV